MRESHFDRSQLPPPRTFYESEGFKLSRPNSKGWAMAKGQPPCHKSKSGHSFFVNVNHGGFRCFGCDAHGDQFDYVSLRDGCDLKTASKTLGCSRDVTPAERTEITRLQQERDWNRQRELDQEKVERRERLDLRNELHLTVKLYRKVEMELHEVGPRAEDHWSALPLLLDDWRMTESSYCNVSRLENPYEFE